MIVLGVLVFILGGFGSHSLNIDLTSLKLDPDLYRLCWRQFDDDQLDYLSGTNQVSKRTERFPINTYFVKGDPLYCIESKDINSLFQIEFPLQQTYVLKINVKFSMPLNYHLPAIRKQVVSTGVIFELNTEFVRYISSNASVTICRVVVTYDKSGKTIIEEVLLNSLNWLRFLMPLYPRTRFTSYSSCALQNAEITSYFTRDEGIVYSEEETSDINPFIQYPFRRFIYAQWKNPPNIPNCYYIAIYRVSSWSEPVCIKKFRAYDRSFKNTKLSNLPKLHPKYCESKEMEHLGFYDNLPSSNMYVMLDMVHPMDQKVVHKLSILWENPINNTPMENFIYFEPLPHERSGIITEEIEQYNVRDYQRFRSVATSIRQNVVSKYLRYPVDIRKEKPLLETAAILPSISATKPELITGKSFEEFQQKCESLQICKDGTNPFFYAIFKQKIPDNKYSIDIAQILKTDSALTKLSKIKMVPNHENSTFTVSWSLPRDEIKLIPSVYMIRMKTNPFAECYAEYILGCSTCNRIYEEASLMKLKTMFCSTKCKSSDIYSDYFKALTTHIYFTTKEMKINQSYTAQVYIYKFSGGNNQFSSDPQSVQAVPWRRLNYMLIGGICIIVAVIVIAILAKFICKTNGRPTIKDTQDSNTYYDEEEL